MLHPMPRPPGGVEGERGRRNPRVLYDGKTVLYGSATLTKLTSDGEQNFRPEWTPDGRKVLYGSSRSRPVALWWQNADLSGNAEIVQSGPEGVNGGALGCSARGRLSPRHTAIREFRRVA